MHKPINYFFVAFCLVLFGLYFYIRLILERLPKEITFSYNLVGFIILSCVIILNLYRAGVFTFLFSSFKSPNKRINKLIEAFYKPFLETLRWFLLWKHAETVFFICNKYIFRYTIKYNYFFIHVFYFQYLVFNFIPRTIIAIALFVDLYNQYFYYLYKVLPVLIIPFLITILFKSCINHFKTKFNTIYCHVFSYPPIFDEDLETLHMMLSIVDEKSEKYFEYHKWVPKSLQSIHDIQSHFSLFMETLYQIAYFKVGTEDPLFYSLNQLLYFILALEWWYLLFHIFLNM